MNDVIQQINLYNNLFKVCLVLSLIFLVVAITIFFMLDIKSTIGYLTGRKAKKQIKELEAANAESGRLMSKGKSMQYLDQKMKSDMGVRQAAALGIRKVEHVVEPALIMSGMDSAQLLQNNGSSAWDANNTTVLTENMNAFYIEDSSTDVLEKKLPQMGQFLIIRELMLIHTEEVI